MSRRRELFAPPPPYRRGHPVKTFDDAGGSNGKPFANIEKPPGKADPSVEFGGFGAKPLENMKTLGGVGRFGVKPFGRANFRRLWWF